MALKKNALVPSERLKECTHEYGGAWTGTVPCTGTYECHMCSTELLPLTRTEGKEPVLSDKEYYNSLEKTTVEILKRRGIIC
jgi:hypothetical protein